MFLINSLCFFTKSATIFSSISFPCSSSLSDIHMAFSSFAVTITTVLRRVWRMFDITTWKRTNEEKWSAREVKFHWHNRNIILPIRNQHMYTYKTLGWQLHLFYYRQIGKLQRRPWFIGNSLVTLEVACIVEVQFSNYLKPF